MSSLPLRPSCHTTMAPPAPSEAMVGYIWLFAAVQTGTLPMLGSCGQAARERPGKTHVIASGSRSTARWESGRMRGLLGTCGSDQRMPVRLVGPRSDRRRGARHPVDDHRLQCYTPRASRDTADSFASRRVGTLLTSPARDVPPLPATVPAPNCHTVDLRSESGQLAWLPPGYLFPVATCPFLSLLPMGTRSRRGAHLPRRHSNGACSSDLEDWCRQCASGVEVV